MRRSNRYAGFVLMLALVAGCTPSAQGPDMRYQIAVQARARFERGELRQAQRALAILARDGRDPVAWVNLGIVQFRRGRHDAAVHAWNAALELDPRHARAHYWLGIAARERATAEPNERRAHLEAALLALEAAANADPASAAIHDVLATTYTDLQRDADAGRARAELRRIDPAGIAVANGAAELGAIVLPPRPQSAGGRVPLGFQSQPLAHRATGVAACDVDGDGRADLVLEGTNTILQADSIAGGSVQFTARSLGDIGRVYTSVQLLADRDGRVDVVLFTEPMPVVESPHEAPPVSTMNPGKMRRTSPAAPAAVQTQLWLLRGGSVTPEHLGAVDAVVRAAGVADLDRDGDSDLLLATNVAPGARLWRNDGGRFTAADPAPPGLEALPPLRQTLCADLDGDRRTDVVTADAAGRLRILVQAANGAFVDMTRDAGLVAERARVVDAADVDGNGRLDLIVGNDDGLWVLANRGGARFARDAAYRAPQTAYAHGPRSTIGVASFVRFDFDNDGGEDLLTMHPRVGGWAPVVIAAVPASAPRDGVGSAAAPVEDAAPELPLPIARESATLALWRATGRGVLQGLADRFDAGDALTGAVAATDLDLDGDLDLTCVRPDSVVVVHWNQGGNANRHLRITVAATAARLEVHAGDLVRVADVSLPRMWFGVRNLERLDVVRVTWPDGRIDNWIDIEPPVDGELHLAPSVAH